MASKKEGLINLALLHILFQPQKKFPCLHRIVLHRDNERKAHRIRLRSSESFRCLHHDTFLKGLAFPCFFNIFYPIQAIANYIIYRIIKQLDYLLAVGRKKRAGPFPTPPGKAVYPTSFSWAEAACIHPKGSSGRRRWPLHPLSSTLSPPIPPCSRSGLPPAQASSFLPALLPRCKVRDKPALRPWCCRSAQCPRDF